VELGGHNGQNKKHSVKPTVCSWGYFYHPGVDYFGCAMNYPKCGKINDDNWPIIVDIKPLSVNQVWRGRRCKTKLYEKYERDLALLLPTLVVPDGRLSLVIEVGFSNTSADIDNPVKPFLDILQKKYDFDDKQIYQLSIIKKIVKKGCEYIAFTVQGME
jgi:Holliday junction resolvase RusA-like endonuclease